MAPLKFLENVVILCLETLFLNKFFGPLQILDWLRHSMKYK